MPPTLNHLSLLSREPLQPFEARVLTLFALSLQRAALAGTARPLLRGKKLGLLCDRPDSPEAMRFERAASDLGGHVAHLRPSLSDRSTPQDVAHTARLLGRLYDAVECQGASGVLARRIGDDAGVPIYDGVATDGHPTAGLADQMDLASGPEDRRRFVLQALLLSTIV